MKKRLLLGLLAAFATVSSFAQAVNTKTGCFVITGENVCTNGTFANADFTGWTPVSAVAGTECSALFSYSADNQSISSTSNLYSEGMYYKFSASSSEPYIVSFKIRQLTGAWPFSTNIRYTTATDEGTGVVTNTYGCSGTNGAGKNYISLFGTNGGVNSGTDFFNTGYAVQLTADWQTVNFVTEADGISRDWYLYICNMATDVEIKDVEIYPAVEVADVRKAAEPLAFAKAILGAYNWASSDELDGLKENIEVVEGITSENGPSDLSDALEGLQDAVSDFLAANMDDYISTCSNGTKWIQKTTKEQKISSIGDWNIYSVNDETGEESASGRWFHCNSNDAATREATSYYLDGPNYGYGLALGHQRLVMTKDLKAGSYIFSLKGNSDTHYMSNTPYTGANGYETNEGFLAGQMTLSIKDAEGNILISNAITMPAVWDEYAQNLVMTNLPADGTYSFVVDLIQPTDNEYYGTNRALGGSYFLTDPMIYCKLEGYNAKQLAYIEAVRAQITAARTNYDTAIGYLENEDYLWGKNDLKACTDTMLVKIERYEAMSDADIIATYDEETYEAGATNENAQLEHEVYVEVARDMIAANRTFVSVNNTLTSLQTAIDNAKAVLNARVYDAAEGKEAFKAVIEGAELLNAELKASDYSEENAQAIADKIAELTVAAEDFKASVPASAITTLADIDFATPAANNGDGTYTIAGATNSIVLPNFNTDEEDAAGTNSFFFQGFMSNGEKTLADMLRVGNGEGVVTIPENLQVTGTNILRLTFDYYFARLTKTNSSPGGTYSGFYLNDADNNKIAQLYYSPYWTAVESEENNTFGLNLSSTYLPSVGRSGQDNAAIAAESNVTHFEIIVDYGLNKMYCTTTTSTGVTQTSDMIPFDGTKMASFSVVSTHENTARRCWFDNLKIEQIAAGEVTTIKGDVNGDGQVGIGDIISVTNYMAGEFNGITLEQADVNGDGEVGIGDIISITNIMAGGE